MQYEKSQNDETHVINASVYKNRILADNKKKNDKET